MVWLIRSISPSLVLFLLNANFSRVLLIDGIEEVRELFFDGCNELVLIFVIWRVVNFGEAVVNFLAPTHIKFLFVEDFFVSKWHQKLYRNGPSITILNFTKFTLIMPVFSLSLFTEVTEPIRWPSGYANSEGLGDFRNFESSHVLNLNEEYFTFQDRYCRTCWKTKRCACPINKRWRI